MILADQFECVIPSANALKEGVLYCTTNPPMSPADSATWAAWVTALGTLLLVAGAFWAGSVAVSTLRQMKHDSIAQTRPYLYADLVPSLSGGSRYDLLIENTGASTARNVTVSCPDFPDNPDDVAQKLKVFLDAKHTLPPKSRIRNYWRLMLQTGHTWSDGSTEPAGMPERALVVLNYEDDDGRLYSDSFTLDVVTTLLASMPEKGPNARSSLSDDQKDTHKMLAVIASAIGELRR